MLKGILAKNQCCAKSQASVCVKVCQQFEVNIYILLDVLLCSIAEYFYSMYSRF